MRIFTFLTCFVLVLTIGTKSSVAQYSFKSNENAKSSYNSVFFKILGIQDENKASLIESSLKSLPEVRNAKIKLNYKCVLDINEALDAKKVRSVLLSHNTDFYFPSLEVTDTSLYNNHIDYKEIMVPDDLPRKEDYSTKQDYYNHLNKWKNENPDKLSILKELGYKI